MKEPIIKCRKKGKTRGRRSKEEKFFEALINTEYFVDELRRALLDLILYGYIDTREYFNDIK